MPRVFASGPRDMRTRNNLGNARVCPGLQAPMCGSRLLFYFPSQGSRKQSADGQAQLGVGGEAANNWSAKCAAKIWTYF